MSGFRVDQQDAEGGGGRVSGFDAVRVWHDEGARLQRTGRLDQGPCWCAACVGVDPLYGDNPWLPEDGA